MDNTENNVEVTAEQIEELLNSGMTQVAASEELGITVGKLKGILKKAKEVTVTTDVDETAEKPASAFAKTYAGEGVTDRANITVMTAGEYGEYSEANGRHLLRLEA